MSQMFGFIFEKVFTANYTIFHNRLLDLGCSDGAVVFYLRITRMMFGAKTSIYPTQEYLSQITGKSDRQIRRYLDELQSAGALKVVHRLNTDGQRTSNLYVICDLSTDPSDKNVQSTTMPLPEVENQKSAELAPDKNVRRRTKMSDKEILIESDIELWCGKETMYEYDRVLYECGIDPETDASFYEIIKVVNEERAMPDHLRWAIEQMDDYLAKGNSVENPIGFIREKLRKAKSRDALLNRQTKSNAYRPDKYR